MDIELAQENKAMKYDFDKIIDRKNTNSSKWDTTKDEVLPMWVADMDFEVAPKIIKTIINKAKHGVFGYPIVPEKFYDAEINWWKKRYNYHIKKEWISQVIGVVPSLSAIIQAFCQKGDKVLVQHPVYHVFDAVIQKNELEVATNDLIYENGRYKIDFEDFENKVKDEKVKLFILCNPHNPVGRVWDKDELRQMGELCIKHNVIVLSDEIHRDLVYKNYKYTPFCSINEEFLQNSITCTAPSKTFNIAGLKASSIIVANENYKQKIDKVLNQNILSSINIFGIEAFITAYESCEDWLDELLIYLEKNKDYLISFIDKNLPKLKVVEPEATYLLWLDISKLNINSKLLAKKLEELGKLRIIPGLVYGENGDNFIRINIACPLEVLKDGLKRLENGIKLL